ncbi:MAG: hypothetical protein N4A36_00260 [Candidatus Gracilibacteria bacterium]|jgi:uncharacterized protein (UPF0303 family)|nr:hypothetical protein [Candidatus Gracilibacteria bacterium]
METSKTNQEIVPEQEVLLVRAKDTEKIFEIGDEIRNALLGEEIPTIMDFTLETGEILIQTNSGAQDILSQIDGITLVDTNIA